MELWIKKEPNAVTKAEIIRCKAEIQDLFPTNNKERLEFGTAGLRANFGPGPLRMNDVTVMQTAQGLMKQLENDFGKVELLSKGIVIGYDHRESKRWGLSSKRLALASACVFLASGYNKIYLFDELVATPFVPFSIQKFGCLAGFMMTASHNPKEDAGFKVYWNNACQLTSPLDDYVTMKILENLEITEKAVSLLNMEENIIFSKCISKNLTKEIEIEYVKTASSKLCRFFHSNGKQIEKKICYTAMHGVGLTFTEKLFQAFNHQPFKIVSAQAKPDPNFSTVQFPNPEEKGALDLAIAYAKQEGCELILANDPDADRLGVAEYNSLDNEWKILTGDEIAMLLGWWELEMFQRNIKNKSKSPAMVVSAVSSGFLNAMCAEKGCKVFETLTGFKWIGSKNLELVKAGYQVIFSYEEAIGFCVGDIVVDKDGITAAAVFAEMYNYLVTTEKTTCISKIDELRKNFGYFYTRNGYIKTKNPKQFFSTIRNGARYPLILGNNSTKKGYIVKRVRDLGKQNFIDTAEKDGCPQLPFASNMITFYLEPIVKLSSECHFRVTLRASGTEPKLKYYIEGNGKDSKQVLQECLNVEQFVVLSDLLKETPSKL